MTNVLTEAQLQSFAYDHVCQSTNPGNAGYVEMSIEAGHAASAGTPLEGFTVDQIRKMFWAEHARATQSFKRARGRA